MSHGRVALKQGFDSVNLDLQDATLNLDALESSAAPQILPKLIGNRLRLVC